ncbi:MAG: lysophospholipid acyltransferase family protein [Candidatus Hydrogenedentes bacterium]|nr:lysophospholipid acyltransferase family protein [Candidatus Hydrogenedentota bacterium]
MKYTVFDTPVVRPVLRGIALAFLKIMGFRVEGQTPDVPKYVAIVAPHTSNWDFVILLAMAFVLRVNARWFGKHTLFRWPFHGLFRWFGGVPIDRGKSVSVVSQYIQAFDAHERFVLALAPEGTRKKVVAWKKGFYHIAVGANAPVALVYLDYKRKAGGFGPLFSPTGDLDADMQTIKEFYAAVTAKYPDQAG